MSTEFQPSAKGPIWDTLQATHNGYERGVRPEIPGSAKCKVLM
jgi:hypothetical protein